MPHGGPCCFQVKILEHIKTGIFSTFSFLAAGEENLYYKIKKHPNDSGCFFSLIDDGIRRVFCDTSCADGFKSV